MNEELLYRVGWVEAETLTKGANAGRGAVVVRLVEEGGRRVDWRTLGSLCRAAARRAADRPALVALVTAASMVVIAPPMLARLATDGFEVCTITGAAGAAILNEKPELQWKL